MKHVTSNINTNEFGPLASTFTGVGVTTNYDLVLPVCALKTTFNFLNVILPTENINSYNPTDSDDINWITVM